MPEPEGTQLFLQHVVGHARHHLDNAIHIHSRAGLGGTGGSTVQAGGAATDENDPFPQGTQRPGHGLQRG
ncbi:hypothetical protein DNI29_21480 [Hymenobacter sediminis]|uniref:hypothetical protein n=1 Tax=Hymenobacter sediminis TaxID=2218621 RepID=UPI000F5116AA|nr:hypothetical protein [Hymenobacter sediminis]RPD44286.1 hypothetical protein DNI29_21480 [Hymenobacter sediminis]